MTPPRSEGFVRMPDAEFEAILTRAAEKGAKRALADVGLDSRLAQRGNFDCCQTGPPSPGCSPTIASYGIRLVRARVIKKILDVFGHFGHKMTEITCFRRSMQTLSARDAKYNFGRLIDTARAEPVTVEKHGRAVVVVVAVEEYERLKAIESEHGAKAPSSSEKK